MKRVKDCKDVSIMSPQDQSVCILQFSCFTKFKPGRIQENSGKFYVLSRQELTNVLK